MRYYEGERVIIRKDLEDFDSVDYFLNTDIAFFRGE